MMKTAIPTLSQRIHKLPQGLFYFFVLPFCLISAPESLQASAWGVDLGKPVVIKYCKGCVKTPLEIGEQYVDGEILQGTYKGHPCLDVEEVGPGLYGAYEDIDSDRCYTKKSWKKNNPPHSPIPDTFKYPFSAMGLLRMRFGDKCYTGSATLIGPDLLITAAHNICGNEGPSPQYADEIIFYAGHDGGTGYLAKTEMVFALCPRSYANGGDGLDIALLVTREELGDRFGYLGLAAPSPELIKRAPLTNAGYPSSNPTVSISYQSTIDIDSGGINYDPSAGPGSSGGAVRSVRDGGYIVGVHTHATIAERKRFGRKKTEKRGGGTLLTEGVLGSLEYWSRLLP